MTTRKNSILLAFSLSLVLAGCGVSHPVDTNAGNASASSVPGMDMTAKVDPNTATVKLPGDKFNISHREDGQITDAQIVARAVCAKKLGIPFQAWGIGRSDAPEYAMFGELGPWTEEMANRFAYTGSQTIYDQVANGYMPEPKNFKPRKPRPELSVEQRDVLEKKCNGTEEVKYFESDRFYKSSPPAAYDLLFTELMQKKLPESSAYQAALKNLEQCYQEVGIRQEKKKDGNNTYTAIVGVDYSKVNEQQIALALKDVQCKTKVDFINRVAQEAAKLQAPIIKKNLKEFTAWRKTVDETLKKAEKYIAAHQDVILND